VVTVADPAALAKAGAARIVARIAANSDRAAICLAGGSSPKQLYQLLATEAYRSQIPWDRVHWFFGDERFVPAADPLSNMAMAREAFLDSCAPAANIHPIPIDSADPKQAAHRYERELKSFYGADQLDLARPLFDVVLLGVGPDGHTASLFPGYPRGRDQALGDRGSKSACRAVRAAGHPDIAGARLVPRNADRSQRRGKTPDPDPRFCRRGRAGAPRSLHRRDRLACRCRGIAGEFS